MASNLQSGIKPPKVLLILMHRAKEQVTNKTLELHMMFTRGEGMCTYFLRIILAFRQQPKLAIPHNGTDHWLSLTDNYLAIFPPS